MCFNKQKLLILGISLFILFPSSYINSQTITETKNVSVSAVVGSIPTIDIGGGGGVYQSGVRFSGLAYPNATVTVQKRDGSVYSVVCDEDGSFSILIPEINAQLFTLFATDSFSRRSTILNFPTVLYSGYITDITGIRFAPTITTDKVSVKKNDSLIVSGSSLPNKDIEIVFDGIEKNSFFTKSNELGLYSYNLSVSLSEGEYSLKTRYLNDTRTSKVLLITVGQVNIIRTEVSINIPGDCNLDQKITLVDFSVLAFWYRKENPPKCVDTNKDTIIDLVDFSIMAFYWNG